MSARSRAHPWFSVSLEQKLLWQTPGAYFCKHGTLIEPTKWGGASCLTCDMESLCERLGLRTPTADERERWNASLREYLR